MAEPLIVEVVSPEAVLYSGEADMVITRTLGGGEVAFQAGHAPFLGALVENHTRVFQTDGSIQDIAIHRGFVEVSGTPTKVSILSDTAELAQDIDVERAKDGPFGGPIAHGFLTLSFLPHLVGQILQVTEASAGVNYGLDKLRFTSPVPVGGRVRANGRLLETQQKGQGIMARVEVTVEIEGSDRPALVATWLILRYP